MGCGCKGGNTKNSKNTTKIETEKVELNLVGVLLKIPMAILVSIFFIIVSPLILVLIWYLAISSVFGKDSNVINLMLFKFKKKNNEIIDNDEELNPDDYELMDVDIIK